MRIRRVPEKILAQCISKSRTSAGYHTLGLYREGRATRALVHRLVAGAFLLRPDDTCQVNHKDGNKSNNNVANLEWISPKENIAHAYRLNLRYGLKGSSHPSASLTEDDVRKIKSYLVKGRTQKSIAQEFGVVHQTISDISRGKSWTHVN